MALDDALFDDAQSSTRHQLEELLSKAEQMSIPADSPKPRPKYRDLRVSLKDLDNSLYDPDPLVFPNSTLQSHQSHLPALSISGLPGFINETAAEDAREDTSEAGTIFSDSVANSNSTQSPNSNAQTNRPATPPIQPEIATDTDETPLKASLKALSRPPSQRPSPVPFKERPERRSSSPPTSTHSQDTSPILAHVSTPFRSRMKWSRMNASNTSNSTTPMASRSGGLGVGAGVGVDADADAAHTHTNTHPQPHTSLSAPPTLNALPSTTPKVSPPRRRSYAHEYANTADTDLDTVESSSSTTPSLPHVASVDNSPVKAPPPRPRWSFGGSLSRKGSRASMRSERSRRGDEHVEEANEVAEPQAQQQPEEHIQPAQHIQQTQRFRDIEAPIKGETEETTAPHSSQQDTTHSSPASRSSFKSSFKAANSTGSKSVSFVNGLGVHDDDDLLSDSEDFINNAHDALVQLEDADEKGVVEVEQGAQQSTRGTRDTQDTQDTHTHISPSNSFDRFLRSRGKTDDDDGFGNSTHLSAGDLAREGVNYSLMKTPQAPGFYPMTPAHIPRNRQSTPIKGEDGEGRDEEHNAENDDNEFDVTKLDNRLDLSTARMSLLKTPQAPGFYPMTPADKYKAKAASPISSNDSYEVVDEEKAQTQTQTQTEDKKQDASLFVALSDIEQALRSTAADVEKRKRERAPPAHNKLLDVFRSDRSADGLAKKAHTRTTDALAAYNDYMQRDKPGNNDRLSRRNTRHALNSTHNTWTSARYNTASILILLAQIIAGYLILQHLYNTLFNSFLTNYFDPLNPDIHPSEYADSSSHTFTYRGAFKSLHDLANWVSNEYIYGRPWPPS